MYFSPEKIGGGAGDTVTVDARIKLDKDEECINTIEGVINFDSEYLELLDLSTGDSILTLWVARPQTSDMSEINHVSRLKFTGGTPGGYCGVIPGDTGDSNVIGKLVFKIKPIGNSNSVTANARIQYLADTKVLYNDGLGTEAKLNLKTTEIKVLRKSVNLSEWEKLKTADNISPEPFMVEVLQNPAIYEGKYYMVWNTTDKQTGIDHYEIIESTDVVLSKMSWLNNVLGFFARKGGDQWQNAEQPYILKDQSVTKLIRVKAVDKAGNERISEYMPKLINESATSRYFVPIVVLLIVIILISIIFIRRRAQGRSN